MKASLELLRSKLPWFLGTLILAIGFFGRIRALVQDVDRVRNSPPGTDMAQALLEDLEHIRPNLPARGKISLLQQGEAQAHELRPVIDRWSALILDYYRSDRLPRDPGTADIVRKQSALLRSRFPGLEQGRLPEAAEIATLLEKVHFATLDAASHTLAQYALVPLVLDPVLRPGLVLARLPQGQARAEALRQGLRWKKAVGRGWYLLEKRP